jgi:4-amino-4-deoxy-L-arabinose transferase-like glycosyltransferase
MNVGPLRTDGEALPTAFKLACLAFALTSCTAWLRPLLLPDEGRYAGVAWEMLRSGDWLTPTLNGLPYFHKPPLFYWITASSLAGFGLTEWAARVAPAIGFSLAVASPYWLVRRWLGPRPASIAALALLAQPLALVAGQYANLDMLVAGLITLTIVALAHATLQMDSNPRTGRPALRLAWGAAALGVLAKGLIGIVIPAAVIGGWLLLSGRWRTIIRTVTRCPEGPVVFVLIAAPWFLLMERIHPGFLDYFFVYQHFTRFATGGFNNQQPVWFYPAVLTLFSLPWLVWIARRALGDRLPAGPERDLVLLCWIWLAAVILFFSIPRSKLVGYVLPAVPPLALLAAAGLRARGDPGPAAIRLWRGAAAFGIVGSLVAVVVIAYRPTPSSRDLSRWIGTHSQPGDAVFMLNRFDFDAGLYARLQAPIRVVERWNDEAFVRSRDNWRKELADARRFNPGLAEQTLITPEQLLASLCAQPRSWVIGFSQADANHQALADSERVREWRGSTLWRFDASRPASKALCESLPK